MLSDDAGTDADVVVVGCGPVGQLTAVLLGPRGWRVVVVERWPEPYPLPRAVTFDHEAARLQAAAGLGHRLAEISEAAREYEWRNAAGQVLLRFEWERPGIIPHMRDLGRTHDAEVAERTIRYHADTIALAKQAREARVKHLVLTHLTPYPSGFMARRLFTQGMTDHYKGELTVGSDGLRIVL